MKVEELMEQQGFSLDEERWGEWYTKIIDYQGEKAFVAITDENGSNVPKTFEEPILVGIYVILIT